MPMHASKLSALMPRTILPFTVLAAGRVSAGMWLRGRAAPCGGCRHPAAAVRLVDQRGGHPAQHGGCSSGSRHSGRHGGPPAQRGRGHQLGRCYRRRHRLREATPALVRERDAGCAPVPGHCAVRQQQAAPHAAAPAAAGAGQGPGAAGVHGAQAASQPGRAAGGQQLGALPVQVKARPAGCRGKRSVSSAQRGGWGLVCGCCGRCCARWATGYPAGG